MRFISVITGLALILSALGLSFAQQPGDSAPQWRASFSDPQPVLDHVPTGAVFSGLTQAIAYARWGVSLAATPMREDGSFDLYVGSLGSTINGNIIVYTLDRAGLLSGARVENAARVITTHPDLDPSNPDFATLAGARNVRFSFGDALLDNYGGAIVIRDHPERSDLLELVVGAQAGDIGGISGAPGAVYSHALDAAGDITATVRTFAFMGLMGLEVFGNYGRALAYDAGAPDGAPDLIVGAPGEGTEGASNPFASSGRGAVHFHILGEDVDPTRTGRSVQSTESMTWYGYSTAWLGTNDNARLVAVGAPNDVPPFVHIRSLAADNTLSDGHVISPAGVVGSRYGAAVAALGDVDGDGFPDLAVGAPAHAGNTDDAAYTGRVFIHLLNDGGVKETFEVDLPELRVPGSGPRHTSTDPLRFGRSLTVVDVGGGQRALLIGAGSGDLDRATGNSSSVPGGAVYAVIYPEHLTLLFDAALDGASGTGRPVGGVGGVITDAQVAGGSVAGIAVEEADGRTIGSWQYQLSESGNWVDLSVDAGNVRLLAADSRLRFVPNVGQAVTTTDQPALTVYLWSGRGADAGSVVATADVDAEISDATRVVRMIPPITPQPVVADATTDSITITWPPLEGFVAVRYEVSVFGEDGEVGTATVAANSAVDGVLSYGRSGLVRGTFYTFSVVAVDAGGRETDAGRVTARTRFETPSAPQGLVAVADPQSPNLLQLTWSTPTETGGPPGAVLHYRVTAEDEGGVYETVETASRRAGLLLRPGRVSTVSVTARTEDGTLGAPADLRRELLSVPVNAPPRWRVGLLQSTRIETDGLSRISGSGIAGFGSLAVAATEADEAGRFKLLVSSAGDESKGQIRIYQLNATDVVAAGELTLPEPRLLDAGTGAGGVPPLDEITSILGRGERNGYGTSIAVLEDSDDGLRFIAGVPREAADGEGAVYLHLLPPGGDATVTELNLVYPDAALSAFRRLGNIDPLADLSNESRRIDEGIRNHQRFGAAVAYDANASSGEVNLIVGAPSGDVNQPAGRVVSVIFPFTLSGGALRHVAALADRACGARSELDSSYVVGGYCAFDPPEEGNLELLRSTRYGDAAAWLGRSSDGRRLLAVGAPRQANLARSVVIHLLERDEPFDVVAIREITAESSGGGDFKPDFGSALAAIGDVDGNGVPDLAVGAPLRIGDTRDDQFDTGVFIYRLNERGEVIASDQLLLFTGEGDFDIGSGFGAALTVVDLGGNRRALAVGDLREERVAFIPYELPAAYRLTHGETGTSVATIIAGDGLDDGTGELRSVAVTTSDAGGVGQWEYSGDGIRWLAVPSTVSETGALLLSEDHRLRFVLSPGAMLDVNARPSLALRLWDGTIGTAGEQRVVFNPGAADRGSAFSVGVRRLLAAPTPPAEAPGNVLALPGSPTEVEVTWDAVGVEQLGGADAVLEYLVSWRPEDERSDVPGGTARVPGTQTRYRVTGLAENLRYVFTVTAVNGSIEPGPTSQAQGLSATPPGEPVNLQASDIRSDQLTVTWESASDNGARITAYRVEVGRESDADLIATTRRESTDGLSHTQTGLARTTTYIVSVSAENEVGTGPAARLTITTTAALPGPPTNVVVASGTGSGELDVSWTAPDDDGGAEITGYTVSWTAPDGGGSADVAEDAVSHTITGLIGGTAYAITVAARNSEGTGPASDPRTATAVTVAGAPVVTLMAGDTSVRVTWTAPDTGGAPVREYEVQWDTSDTFPDPVSSTTAATATDITELVNGQEYFVRVRARNSRGFGAFSGVVSAVSRSVPGAPVVAATAGADGTSLNLSWTEPDDGGDAISSYRVEWTRDGQQAPSGNTDVMDATSFTITGLAKATTYIVTVGAENSAGLGPPGSTRARTAFTAPDEPTALELSADATMIRAAWTAPDDTGGAEVLTYTLRWSTATRVRQSDGSFLIVAGDVLGTLTDVAVTEATIPGLIPETVYAVEVEAVNESTDPEQAGSPVRGTVRTAPRPRAREDAAYVKAVDVTLNDRFGGAVALNRLGNVLAVGAIQTAGSNGNVHIFRRVGSIWQPQGDPVTGSRNENPTASNQFGASVALNEAGDVLAVGAPEEDGSSLTDSGAVYVFRYDGNKWLEEDYLTAEGDASAQSRFGDAVALNAAGDRLVVGVPGRAGQVGSVYAFLRTPEGWGQQNRLDRPGENLAFRFGHSVALNGEGDVLAVGESPLVVLGSEVYVFRRSGNDWSTATIVTLRASHFDSADGDQFGHAVALNKAGDVLAVGAPREDSAATGVGGDGTDDASEDSGAVYVFRGDGSGWSEEAYIKASNTGAGDVFGMTVALNGGGDVLAVGAPGEDSAATGVGGDAADDAAADSGAVYVFRRGADNQWGQEAYIKALNSGQQDQFGSSVALDERGAILAVGAPGEDSDGFGDLDQRLIDNNLPQSGAAFVITVVEEAVFSPTAPRAVTLALVASADGASAAIRVTWQGSESDGGDPITAYRVLSRQLDESSYGDPSTVVSVNVAGRDDATYSHTITGLAKGTSYAVTVVAVNTVGPTLGAEETIMTAVTVPGAPRNLSVARGDGGELVVTWQQPADVGGTEISGYTVSWASSDGADTGSSDDDGTSIGPAMVSYTITGLSNGVEYTVRITATNSEGTSESTEMKATPLGVPSAPGLIGLTAGDGRIEVAWTESDDVGGEVPEYRVVWRAAADVQDSSATATGPPHVISDLTNGVEYTVRITAENSAGASESDAQTATPLSVPGAPTDLNAIANADGVSLTLSWTAPADTGGADIEEYAVSWRLDEEGADASTMTSGVDVNTSVPNTTATIGGLEKGSTYSVTVRARNEAGFGETATAVEIRTEVTVPGAPVLTLASGETTLVATWTVPDDTGGVDAGTLIYNLRWTTATSVRPDGDFAETLGEMSGISDLTAAITGLAAETEYTVEVTAANSEGEGEPTATNGTTTAAGTPPGPVGGLSLTPGATTMVVVWNVPDDLGDPSVILDYDLAWAIVSDDGMAPEETRAAPLPPTDGTEEFTIPGLLKGTTYVVMVRARNVAGFGPAESATAETLRTVADAPTDLSATENADGVSLTLSWTAPADTGGADIEEYVVSWRLDEEGAEESTMTSGVDVSTSAPNTTATISGLEKGTTYSVTVTARNAVGFGGFAPPVTVRTAITIPGVPQNVSLERGGSGELVVAWDEPMDTGGAPISRYTVAWMPADGGAGGSQVVSASVEQDALSVTIMGLGGGVTYAVTVTAENSAGAGLASDPVEELVVAVPGAPTDLSATENADGVSLTLSWTAPADTGGADIEEYVVSWRLDEEGAEESTMTSGVDVNTSVPNTTATIGGLEKGTTYSVTVRARNAAGFGEAVTVEARTAATVPGAPVLTLAAGETTLVATWTAPVDTGGVDAGTLTYNLRWTTATSVRPGGDFAETLGETSGISDLTAAITGLAAETEYTVEVTAVNSEGEGEPATDTGMTIAPAPAGIRFRLRVFLEGALQ